MLCNDSILLAGSKLKPPCQYHVFEVEGRNWGQFFWHLPNIIEVSPSYEVRLTLATLQAELGTCIYFKFCI